jgi:hypothetical protein
MRKIAREIDTTMTFVANNFIASMDFSENARVSAQYEKLLHREKQLAPIAPKKTNGRPSKK